MGSTIINIEHLYANGKNQHGLISWKEGVTKPNTISSVTFAAVASFIGTTTGESKYNVWAKEILDTVIEKLYDKDNGKVFDCISDDGVAEYCEHASNAGMFVRACCEIYDYTQD